MEVRKTERRQFIKGVSLFAAIAAGYSVVNTSPTIVVTTAPERLEEQPVEDISHLAPPGGAPTFQITGSFEKAPETKPQYIPSTGFGQTLYYVLTNPTVTHKTEMSVGMDNRLWIKVGDTWKRVAIEG